MQPEELLARIARKLREEIGPAVGDGYAKTQAFMAAVVLEKLSGQLATAAADAAADRDDVALLARDLDGILAAGAAPDAVRAAVEQLHDAGADASQALGRLVEALYEARGELGDERFDAALGRVRRTLRAGLDRRARYAA